MIHNGAHKFSLKNEPSSMDEKVILEDENSHLQESDSMAVMEPENKDLCLKQSVDSQDIPHPSPISGAPASQFSKTSEHDNFVPLVDVPIDSSWDVVKSNRYAFNKDICKNNNGHGNSVFSAVLTFVMGIVALLRITRSMPRKLTEATIYSSSDYCAGTIKGLVASPQLPGPTISRSDYMSVLTRLANLEDKMITLSKKPVAMPSEKEEMLNAALSRVGALEQELSSTKRALEETMSRQAELVAYFDKKKKKKNILHFFGSKRSKA
uniref:Uncharacterized protein n=1 Tax=Kalanchoe fedtschenkoi TaxID=63787 RepID=A0A7N0T940_KALFE